VSNKQPHDSAARRSRRTAIRAGAVGVGLLAGATGALIGPPTAAAQSGWRMEHLEIDAGTTTAIDFLRAGSGPPQPGDYLHHSAPLYAAGDVTPTGEATGPQIGLYECFGVWTHAGTDTTSHHNRLVTAKFDLFDRGLIVGVVYEGGVDPNAYVGAVQGGTGEFVGALGTFQQRVVSTMPARRVRAVFDLMLPNIGGA
jgi:hypothetical protein